MSLTREKQNGMPSMCLSLRNWNPSTARYLLLKGKVEKGINGGVKANRIRLLCRGDIRVLVPGAGLGRLAYDIATHGFSCQGRLIGIGGRKGVPY
jgi:hypothetical protein